MCVKGCLSADAVAIPHVPAAADGADFDIFEEFLAMLPDNLMDWLALIVLGCAMLSVLLPPPPQNAPKICHGAWRLICALGLGASRMRGRGRGAAQKLGTLLRRRK